jgi:hypothetical protein
MKRTTLLVSFVLLATAASAHQDRILSVRADGAIPELPPAYQTTRLHVALYEAFFVKEFRSSASFFLHQFLCST